MAVRLSQVMAEQKTLQMNVGDDVLHLTYRPRAITPATAEGISELFAADRNGRAVATWVAETITKWDLLGADEQPLALDMETLVANVPGAFLNDILVAVSEDMRPGEAKSATSADG